MSVLDEAPATLLSPLPEQRFVMVRAPSSGYAGYIGAEAVVTDVANGSVYVLFQSGIRDCYPPKQFECLFRPRRSSRAMNEDWQHDDWHEDLHDD
jgi:hypothetical protein